LPIQSLKSRLVGDFNFVPEVSDILVMLFQENFLQLAKFRGKQGIGHASVHHTRPALAPTTNLINPRK
jgi:hypothetical protein